MESLFRTVRVSDFTVPFVNCVLLAALVAGCSAARRHVDAEKSISRALGTENVVVFREAGARPDAGEGSVGLLTIAEAVRRAIENSPELQAALARVRVAQADADQAALLPNPVLSFVLRFPEGAGRPELEAGLGADLLAILERPRRADAAGKRLEAEALRALSTALDIVAGVQEQYFDIQASEALLAVLDQRLQLSERLREVVQARLDMGEGTRIELTWIESERTELALEAAQQGQEATIARLGLARAIGEPSGAAAWILLPWSAPPALQTAEEIWIAGALAGRPELLAIEWELHARAQDERLARGRAFDGSSLGLGLQRDADWSMGPSSSAPLPIFDTGRTRAERARAMTSEERHRLTQAQRSVIEEVRAALANLTASTANHERVVRDLIPVLQQRRADTEAALQQGFIDIMALHAVDHALLQAQVRRIHFAREVSLAQNRLQRSVGGPFIFQSNAVPLLERSQQ